MLAPDASAQRRRSGERSTSKDNSSRRKSGGKKVPNKRTKKKTVKADPDAAKKDDAARALQALANTRTLEDDKHLTRMAVISRLKTIADEKTNPQLKEKATKLETLEGDRHRKSLARFATWNEQISKGESVAALMPKEGEGDEADTADKADKAEKKQPKKTSAKKSGRKAQKGDRGRADKPTRASEEKAGRKPEQRRRR